MKFGKLDAQSKVIDHWQLLHESDFEDTDTKLLLHLDNDVVDYATGKTVTNTNVTFSSTVWKFNTHSGVFNGSTAYLSLADHADWTLGTGNFTIDCWVRFNSVSTGTYQAIASQYQDANNYWYISYNDSTQKIYGIFVIGGVSVGTFYTDALALTTGVWYHFAWVRSGTTFYIFLNGVSQTLTIGGASGNMSDITSLFYIGSYYASFYFLNGYIDEFRWVKGTAKWTSNFTPPTAPYLGRTTTYPITTDRNTVLMISGEGADASTTVIDECGKAVTCNGDAKILKQDGVFDGGAYFNASSFIYAPDHADWSFGTGDFTIDMWVKFRVMDSTYDMFYSQHVGGTDYVQFYREATTNQLHFTAYTSSVAQANYITTNAAFTETGVWYHIAAVRNGTNFYLFVNGVSQTLTVNTAIGTNTMPDVATQLVFGANQIASTTHYLDGWLDEIRVSKGTARWTANFTPPTSAYTSDANTQLLLHLNGNLTDSGNTVHTITNSGARLGVAKWGNGTGSVAFDGTGDYLSLADSADWYMGSNDWTIDFWFRANSFSSASFICGQANTASPGTNFFEIHVSYDQLYFQTWVSSSRVGRVTSTVLSLTVNTWNHFAIVKTSGTYKAFVNGTDMTQPANTLTGVSGDYDGLFTVGSAYDSDGNRYYTNGWIDDFRVSKGLARWTSAFTPPLRTTALINGDTDEEYRVLSMQYTLESSNTCYLRFNNDSSSNYGQQVLYGDNATISASRAALSYIALGANHTATPVAISEVVVYAKSGYTRTMLDTYTEDISGTTVTRLGVRGYSWNNSTAPIAAMNLDSTASLAIAPGSKLLLYRKVR